MRRFPEDEKRAAILERVFRKSGGRLGLETGSFHQFDTEFQTEVIRASPLIPSEVVVLASRPEQGCWVAVTTRRVVWARGAQVRTLPLPEILRCEPEYSEEFLAGRATKLEHRVLKLVAADGQEYRVELEPGGAFMGIWNAVLRGSFLARVQASREDGGQKTGGHPCESGSGRNTSGD